MKTLLTTLLLTLTGLSAMAQSKFNVSGSVVEKGTNEAVVSATVRILSLPDSAMVGGAATTATGSFTVKDIKKGKYAVKVTYIGYQDNVIALDLTNKKSREVNIGAIAIAPDAKVLKEAKVTAAVAKVQVNGDSIIYNADAYRVPEGSALQELVKQMPGAEVDDEGNIKINGKTVKKIMMNGKEFFDNDTKVAMQNIPTDIIDKIKTYDRKSDFSRVTGIDDGEEETVLDLTVKKGMNKGFTGNARFGVGTENRYNGRLFGMGTLEDAQIQLVGGMNNVGDRDFGGGGGRGGFGFGGGGLRASKNLGVNFGTAGDKLETGGNIRFRYDGSDSKTWSSTQNFSPVSLDFRNSFSKSIASNTGINMNFRLEWKPDSMTNIIFRPSANYSRNRGMSGSEEVTFNQDPDDYYSIHEGDILGNVDALISRVDSFVVNTNYNNQQTFSTNKGMNGEFQVNRRLNNEGRNITLRATGSISESESKNLSANHVKYYTTPLPDAINNRYATTPGRNRSYSAQLTYSEPIAFRTYLQFSYRFNYSYSMNDRQTAAYLSNPTAYEALRESLGAFRYNVDGAVDYLLSNYGMRNDSIVPNLSQYSEYNNYNHNISVSFRKVTDLYNLSAGVDLLPQSSVLNYMGNNITELTEVRRSVFNYAPHLDLRLNFDKQTQLRLNYRSNTSQPSMTSLLDIVDDSDVQNKTQGNTGLKPSFSHNLNGNFNTFDMEHQRSIFVFFNAGFTQNAFTQRISYEEGGKRTTKQENINGNWNGMLGLGFNTALDSEKYLTLNTFTTGNYNHQVSYLDPKQYTEEKSATNSMNLMENLSLSYRKDWFQMSLNGNVNYQHSRNNVMSNNNLDSWSFSYGTEINLIFDNGFSFSTDIAENSRRGYSQKEMNTNELVWNALISKSFLKGNALTITAQWNDILGKRSNISRTIDAMMSRDSRSNAIYSYGMITAIYKLNIFGGANTSRGGERGQWGGRGGFPGGGMPMGGFGGGFGGGRPRM